METVLGKSIQVADSLLACQLDGKGNALPMTGNSVASQSKPFWLHLNYENRASATWLAVTPIVPDLVREALAGQSSRPRVTRLGEGTFIALRSINFNSENLPDPLVAIRIYLTENIIISTRCRLVASVEDIRSDLDQGIGPISNGDWLVDLANNLTDHASEFIDDLHDRIIEIEDGLMEQQIPERGEIALIRKQLIILRRHLLPQRDVFARLAIEKLNWMKDQDRRRMKDVADRLGRVLDDLDASIARTIIITDEINTLMSEATNRRTYTMSIMAMFFLPATFLTGLFGVNLAGIPAAEYQWSFAIFCFVLFSIGIGVGWWLKRSKWL